MKYIPINEIPSAIRASGLSQTEIAKRLGIKKQSVNNWCRGIAVASLRQYEKSLKILENERNR